MGKNGVNVSDKADQGPAGFCSCGSPSGERVKQDGGRPGSFYWIKCWDRRRWTRKGYRRQFYYTFMSSNGQVLATSEGLNNRRDRDVVVQGLLRDKLQMAVWVDKDGYEITRYFMIG